MLISIFAFSQTNYSDGFKKGFKNGYCQDQGVGCIAPNPPIPPLPKIGESNESYTNGYNRGFLMGLEAQKSGSSNSKRFKTSRAKFIDKMDNVDYSNAIKLALILRESKGKALEFYKNEEYQASLDIALKGLSIRSNDEEFMILAGQALLGLNKSLEALPHLKRAYRITKDPNIKKVIIDIENGRAEAIKKSGSNKLSKTNAQKINQLLDEEKYVETISMIDSVVRSDENHRFYGLRGMANFNLENYSQAILDITKMAEVSSKIPPSFLVYRANAKSNLKDYYGSISDLDIVIDNHKNVYGDMASVYNNKAYSLLLLGNAKEASPIINKALKLNSKRDYIWDTKGEVEYKLGNYKKSISAMQKAINIRPSGNSYYFKGLANIKLNKIKKGCTDLSRAGELGKVEAYEEIKKYCN